ncbi:MAG: biotin--[Clostridia bacterium]|nr:biotin--[acetyl-CoA-carboxylase] ligase [Clostridia bacterium]
MNGEQRLQFYRFDELPSTQDYARALREKNENAVVIAKSQSGGKGTKGRSFSSAEGGLYLSLLLCNRKIPARQAFFEVARAAVAVCKTLEKLGLSPVVKWPNDILIGGKKICGILIENTLCGGEISCSVVGIGLNVNNRLEEELSEIAATVYGLTGKKHGLSAVEKELLENYFSPFSYEDYTARLGYIGKRVKLSVGEKTQEVRLLGVSERGELIAEREGEKVVFAYGEVSIAKESL